MKQFQRQVLIRLQVVGEIDAKLIDFNLVDHGFTNQSGNRCRVMPVFELVFSRVNSPETEGFGQEKIQICRFTIPPVPRHEELSRLAA